MLLLPSVVFNVKLGFSPFIMTYSMICLQRNMIEIILKFGLNISNGTIFMAKKIKVSMLRETRNSIRMLLFSLRNGLALVAIKPSFSTYGLMLVVNFAFALVILGILTSFFFLQNISVWIWFGQ